MSKLAHSNQATMDKIERDQIAREARGDDEPRAAHTPGPWLFSPEKTPHHYGVNVGAETGECLAVIHPGETGDAETIANARLIAAAPLMLEALQNIENDDEHMPPSAWKLIQDAIAKAKGE